MQKIGDSTTTANGAGEFTQGQAGSGIDATMITAAWLNAIQREVANVVLGAGIVLSPNDDSQMFKAIQAIQTAANTWAKLAGKPTTVAGFGLTDAFTKSETNTAIQQAVSALVASSPAALDTLKELAEALGNDPNFATTMTNSLAGKADKATSLAGYGITNTYTKDEITALIAALNPENRRKTSPWVPMSLGGAYTFSHGFGVEPWVSSLEVKCVVATTGFAVGATIVVSVAGSADGGSSSTSSPIGVWHDETNAYARFGAATAVNLTRPADGVQVAVPFANFQVRLKVEK